MTEESEPARLRGPDPAHNVGTYWRQESETAFTLVIGGRPAATANMASGVAFLTPPGGPHERLVAQDSRPVFDVVEQRLGTGRVDEWLGLDGGNAIACRHRAEDAATAFSRRVSAAREPRRHLTSAWQWLDQGAHERTLSLAGEQAHRHVRAALRSHEIHGRWTSEGRRHVDEALRALDGPGTEGQSYGEQQAGVDCAKARACLEERQAARSFEDALKKAARHESGRKPKDRTPDRER